jgi:hypothetical protein
MKWVEGGKAWHSPIRGQSYQKDFQLWTRAFIQLIVETVKSDKLLRIVSTGADFSYLV